MPPQLVNQLADLRVMGDDRGLEVVERLPTLRLTPTLKGSAYLKTRRP